MTHSWLYGSDEEDKGDDVKFGTKKTGNGTVNASKGGTGRSKASMKYTYSDSESED